VKRVVETQDAPKPIGPYSQAIAVPAGTLTFLSGQLGIDPLTGALVDGDVAAQARQVIRNIGALLACEGLDYGNVVKTTIFLVDMADFAAVNAVYGAVFSDRSPARSTVAVVGLPLGARVEIECLAVS
jgi:2-iminobutanoate/2-iminopropanoate deaminase